jgi:nucleoside-diphosphate-sugar epimerase
VIGLRLLPLLVADGHEVAAMTRSPQKADQLRALGGEPVVCDVFDRDALSAAVTSFAPEMVMHQLTDLPTGSTSFGTTLRATTACGPRERGT